MCMRHPPPKNGAVNGRQPTSPRYASTQPPQIAPVATTVTTDKLCVQFNEPLNSAIIRQQVVNANLYTGAKRNEGLSPHWPGLSVERWLSCLPPATLGNQAWILSRELPNWKMACLLEQLNNGKFRKFRPIEDDSAF